MRVVVNGKVYPQRDWRTMWAFAYRQYCGHLPITQFVERVIHDEMDYLYGKLVVDLRGRPRGNVISS